MNPRTPLRSAGFTRVFTLVLAVGAVANLLALVHIATALFSPATYGRLFSFDVLLVNGVVLGELASLLLLAIWLTLVMIDLRRLDPSYDISRATELIRIWLPVYNLYGIWRTMRELAEFFKAGAGRIGQLGDRMQLQLVLLTMAGFVTRYFVPMQADAAYALEGSGAAAQLLTRGWNLAFALFFLFFVRRVVAALELTEAEELMPLE